MRYITVPSSINVNPPDTFGPKGQVEEVSFKKYALSMWLQDPRSIEGGFVKQVRWAKVIEAFDMAKPGDVIPLEDEDYAILRAIVEVPRAWMAPSATVQLLSYSRTVLDALDKPAQ